MPPLFVVDDDLGGFRESGQDRIEVGCCTSERRLLFSQWIPFFIIHDRLSCRAKIIRPHIMRFVSSITGFHCHQYSIVLYNTKTRQ